MKWTHVGWLLAGLLTASASLRAADVTLTVNGKVVARPCTVSTVNATAGVMRSTQRSIYDRHQVITSAGITV